MLADRFSLRMVLPLCAILLNLLFFKPGNLQAQEKNTIPTDSLTTSKADTTSRKTTADSSAKSNLSNLQGSGASYFNTEVNTTVNDQLKASLSYRLLYDSVIATNNKDNVFNSLTVTNNTDGKLEVAVVITSPESWQMITSNIINIQLEPFGSSILPIRFSPSGNNTANWQQVRIEYRINNILDTRKTFFRLKVQEYSGFKASLPASTVVLMSYKKNQQFPVFIKNLGNSAGSYKVTAENQLLKLSFATIIELPAGKDTLLVVPFVLSESQYSFLKKEDIKVLVQNGKTETINLIQTVSKVGHLLRDHSSGYLDMPLQFEAGAMYQGEEAPIQYYGALFGNVDFNADNHFSMSLRSNTIAQGQTNKNSMVRLDFTGKNVQASAGNIQSAGEFIADGYGARIGYDWNNKKNKIEAYGMLHSRVGDTKLGGLALHLGLGDKVKITDAVSLAQDNIRKVNSGIISQITEMKFKNGRLSLITGFGGEQNDGNLIEGSERALTGTSLGYNFQWTDKHLSVLSNVLVNSNGFPGLFKGQRLQMHDLRWLLGNKFIGGYYEYNYREQNYWLDTVLINDAFNIKTSNVGIRTGISFSGNNIILSCGNQKQLQEGINAYQTTYDYLSLNFSSFIAKKIYLNITSFAGNLSALNQSEKVTVTSNQGSLQYKGFGASFRFDKGPYYYQEYGDYLATHGDYERLIFSPYAELHLLKKSLNVRIQGNYARTMPADVTSSNVLANITYSNPRGYDFNINGILPVGESAGNSPYLSVALRMRLVTPFLAVRKYYNLKLVLFKDKNSNGTRDDGEEPVAGQTLSLNGDLFVSDGDGMVIYKNTEKGVYKADFGYSSKLKGWTPSNGTTQSFDLTGNKSIPVPYKVSHVLNGKLILEKDSLSTIQFNPANIKVTAKGESGANYSTLTDDKGEFYFNLPAGNYIVSLSEAAFSDQFRPVETSQTADLIRNESKTLYFEIKQKRRQINIKKK
jgi:hypothetical protein